MNGDQGEKRTAATGGSQQRKAAEDWFLVLSHEDENSAEVLALTRVPSGCVRVAHLLSHLHLNPTHAYAQHTYSVPLTVLSSRSRRSATLTAKIPDDLEPGSTALELTLSVASACYLGLDQKLKVNVPVSSV